MHLSILVSSYNRLPLFRRALHSIATRPPRVPFEIVVADEGSTDDIEGLLRTFSSVLHWTLVRVDIKAYEQGTGVKKYHNCPSLTNNVAFAHSRGKLVALTGNEIIVWGDAYNQLLASGEGRGDNWLAFSTTYDLGPRVLDRLDDYGTNLTQQLVDQCHRYPLHSEQYRSDVTNYLSLCPRGLWEAVGGYDERYVGGISADDSDFVRRVRAFGAKTFIVPDAVTLHQFHHGKTTYYDPPPSVISQERWDEGVRRNHAIYHAWDGTHKNPTPWSPAKFGVTDIISNWR